MARDPPSVYTQFVELCRQLGLLTTPSVAIDGSKFKAVNNRDRNFTRGKVGRRRAQLEESVARYLSQLDTADRQEPTEALAAKTKHLKEKLAKLDGEMKRLAAYEKKMLASPDEQISSTDPDSRSNGNEWARLWGRRLQRASGRNVQVAVETKPSNRNTRRDNFRFRSSAALTCWQGRKGGHAG